VPPVKLNIWAINMIKSRLDHELPQATQEWGWKYHHLGIPTDKKMPKLRFFTIICMGILLVFV
jgi:hypothetical protein